MAIKFHIGGPMTMSYGGSEIGRTDGRVLASFTSVEPSINVEDDSAGGMPVDEITQDSVGLLAVVFQAADLAVMNNMRARLKDYQTLAGRGEAQRPGYLRRSDSNENRELVLTPTKLTANNGLEAYTFLDAIMDAETDAVMSEIGMRAARFALTMRCYSKLDSGTWKLFTTANVT
jgi:hypothetical protein